MNNSAFVYSVGACILFFIGFNGNALCLKIKCIPIDACPFANDLLKSGLTKESIEFIDNSRCGYDNNNRLKIWCIQLKNCKTPDKEDGTCTYYKKCARYMALLKEAKTSNRTFINHLKEFVCDLTTEKELHVCCPKPEVVMRARFDDSDEEEFKYIPSNEESSQQNRRHVSGWHHYHEHGHNEYPNVDSFEGSYERHDHRHGWSGDEEFPHRRDSKHSRLPTHDFNPQHGNTVPLNNSITDPNAIDNASDESQSELTCETPDQKIGACKNVKDCPSLINLMKKLDRNDPSQRQYIQEFKCVQSKRAEIQVCCPDGEVSFPRKPLSDRRLNLTDKIDDVLKSFSRICGKQGLGDNRIYGGTATDLGEFPWMALLQYTSRNGLVYGCAGSLITNRFVLTAGHCVDKTVLNQRGLNTLYRVVLGEYDTRNETDCFYFKYGTDCADKPQYFDPVVTVKHDAFNRTINDIALIKLDRDVMFTDYISPICLPEGNINSNLKGNETLVIAGWGRTESGEISPLKRKTKLPNIPKENCSALNPQPLTEGQMCLGSGNGTDSCSGDSGGPVMMDLVSKSGDQITALFGIISYGFGSCGTSPSVSTYVPPYMEWIKQKISVL